jgi:predicted transcriptional regulator
MKFAAWVKQNKNKKIDIARSLGITYRALYNYEQGRRPSLRVAHKIVAVSGGKVSYNELAK